MIVVIVVPTIAAGPKQRQRALSFRKVSRSNMIMKTLSKHFTEKEQMGHHQARDFVMILAIADLMRKVKGIYLQED